MIIKILRTVIGLPFVILIWLLSIVLLPLELVFFLGAFVVNGYVGDEEFMCQFTSPYRFIKHVWGKDD